MLLPIAKSLLVLGVISSSVKIGRISANACRDKYLKAKAVCDFFVNLKIKSGEYLIPLESIFRDYDDTILKDCGFLYELNKPNRSVRDNFTDAVYCLNIPQNITERLLTFGQSLGLLTAHEQSESLKEICSFLCDRVEILRAECVKSSKTAKSVCVIGGLIFTVILI